jgi:hypothetical protein
VPLITPASLVEPQRVVTRDVADWPGAWSPNSRFYIFFRWRGSAPCSGESVHAYDVNLERDIRLSSDDYITLGDEVVRTPLEGPPPTCVDRDIPLPPVLEGLPVSRARWSPDESLLAVATVPDDDAYRFEDIPGNREDLLLFQRLDLAVFPADGLDKNDLQRLGPIFDLGPDSAREEDCPGTQIRWSEDGQAIISSMGPVIFDARSGEPILAPDGPNAGPLGPNRRWSPDDWRVVDDQRLLDLRSGKQHTPPGILPGYDRGFAGNERLIYVNETGLGEYDITTESAQQLTDFRLAIFVVAPDGGRLAYADDGDLWMIDLSDD